MRIENIERRTAEFISSIADKAFYSAGQSLKTTSLTFNEYMAQAWHIIEPATALVNNWHIECIAEHLEAVIRGQIQNLIINLPPRSLKSNIVSKLWPTWAWTQQPWLKWVFVSYAQSLSETFSKDRRDIIESDWYRRRWGTLVQIAKDQNQKKEFQNTAHGHMIATSIGGTLTGKGADIIVIDDGIDPERAASKADREAAIRFVKGTIATRLNDKKKGAMIEVSQRTHKQDITGTLLAEGTYTHLNLPAIAPSRIQIEFPISKKIKVREAGEVLHPAREDSETLAKQKVRMNIPGMNAGRSWEAQYQQNPTSDEGALFKRTDWKFYTVKPEFLFMAWSWDTAMEEGEENDWTVGVLVGFHAAGVIVEKVIRQRMQYPEAKAAIQMQWQMNPAHALLIEDKVSGKSLQQDLRRSTDLPVIPVKVHGDKVFRAQLASQYVAARRVALPEGAIWVPEFIEEFAEFPQSEFKDQVDAFSQAINHRYLNYQQPAMGMSGSQFMVTSNGHKNGNGFHRTHADWM